MKNCAFGWAFWEGAWCFFPGRASHDPFAAQLLRASKKNNWRWENGIIITWSWTGVFEREGCLYLKAPKDIVPAQSQALNREYFSLWENFGTLARLHLDLLLAGYLPRRGQWENILASESAFLGMSASLVEETAYFQTEASSSYLLGRTASGYWSALLGKDLSAFFLSSVKSESQEETMLPLELRIEGLDPELCGLCDRSALPGSEPDWGEWVRYFEKHPEGVPLISHQAAEHQKWLTQRNKILQKVTWEKRWKVVFSKYRTHLIIAAVALGILTLIGLPDLLGVRSGETVSYTSEWDVVYAYYRALDQNDAPTLRRLSDSILVKDDYLGAAQLRIFDIVRESSLGTKGLQPLTEWRKQGEPPLPTGLTVVGIDAVAVRLLAPDTYEVTYHRAPGETLEETGRPLVLRVKDILRLEYQGGNPRLIFLQRQEEVLNEPSS